MGDKTGISWTDASWNCIRGCSRVSEGCRHCYAETMAGRFSDPGQPYHGLVTLRKGKVKPKWNGKVDFIPKHLLDPLRWQKPRRIFVNSMSDIFHENLSFEHIAAIFAVMLLAKQHKFQVLTKRSKRMKEFFVWAGTLTMPQLIGYAYRALKDHPEELKTLARADRNLGAYTWPLPNVWLGVSVEDQAAADERIPDLLACPAAIRFLSCEPLIGPITLPIVHVFGDNKPPPRIHWIIAGCESGPGMRPCDHRWLRMLRDQCRDSDTKFFLKQATEAQEGGHRLYPSGQAARAEVVDVVKVGKGSKMKPGGVIERPYLDGFQHQEFPA